MRYVEAGSDQAARDCCAEEGGRNTHQHSLNPKPAVHHRLQTPNNSRPSPVARDNLLASTTLTRSVNGTIYVSLLGEDGQKDNI